MVKIPKKVKNYFFDKLEKKCTSYIERKLKAPDNKTIKKWGLKILPKEYRSNINMYLRGFRKKLPIISQRIPDGRKTSSRRKKLGKTFESPSWISADLGFFRLGGKNYGSFFIAVQSITNQIFIQKILNKKWSSIKPIIENLLKTPGFQFTKRILIDGEAAFSDKNMAQFSNNDIKVIRIWPDTGRKAYKAERAIRTFKEVISRIIYIKKVHISKWYMYIKEALKILNENVTILTENNIHDFLLKNYNQYFGIPQKKFMYQIGEKVVLKARATPDGMKKSLIPGFKRSLAGYDEKRLLNSKDSESTEYRRITARKWIIGGNSRSNRIKTAVQLYKVSNSNEWFPLTDLATRI